MTDPRTRPWSRLMINARARRGLTQKSMARYIGVTYSTYRSWEKGLYLPFPTTARAVDDALGWKPGTAYRLSHPEDPAKGEENVL